MWVELHTDAHQHIPPTQTSEHDILQSHLRLSRLLDRGPCVFSLKSFFSLTTLHMVVYASLVKKTAPSLNVMWLLAGLITQRERKERYYTCLMVSYQLQKTRNRHPRRIFVSFLRLEINVACVLSPFYKCPYCKRNMQTVFVKVQSLLISKLLFFEGEIMRHL